MNLRRLDPWFLRKLYKCPDNNYGCNYHLDNTNTESFQTLVLNSKMGYFYRYSSKDNEGITEDNNETIHTPNDCYLDLEANEANTEEEVQDDDEALQGILFSINSASESE